MIKQEITYLSLNAYLPEGAFYILHPLLDARKSLRIIIRKARKTILGNYIYNALDHSHTITINNNLNAYAFLITLLHELAHMDTYLLYSNQVAPHGKEWQHQYGRLLHLFIDQSIFPKNITDQLMLSIHRLKASSCADVALHKALKMYDHYPLRDMGDKSYVFVEQIGIGKSFMTKDKRSFMVMEKLRKRYKCKAIATGKLYLFSPIYEVKPLS